MVLTVTPQAGWYPDPDESARQRYFDGANWTQNYAPFTAPIAPTPSPAIAKSKACACERCGFETTCTHGNWVDRHPAWTIIGALSVLGCMSFTFSVNPLAGAVITAVAAAMWAFDAIGRNRQRRHALAARADWEYRAAMAHNAQTPKPPQPDLMREAWQPDPSSQLPMPAVRPANPAPWHVVTQWPTRQFGKEDESPR
jgi:hypothetical protein